MPELRRAPQPARSYSPRSVTESARESPKIKQRRSVAGAPELRNGDEMSFRGEDPWHPNNKPEPRTRPLMAPWWHAQNQHAAAHVPTITTTTLCSSAPSMLQPLVPQPGIRPPSGRAHSDLDAKLEGQMLARPLVAEEKRKKGSKAQRPNEGLSFKMKKILAEKAKEEEIEEERRRTAYMRGGVKSARATYGRGHAGESPAARRSVSFPASPAPLRVVPAHLQHLLENAMDANLIRSRHDLRRASVRV